MRQIENKIFIDMDRETVFQVTNDIASWKNLFSEYEESEVLWRKRNKVRFRLTTKKDESSESYSWESERIMDYKRYQCLAFRKKPLYPFLYMKIFWEYHENGSGTDMIWRQTFELDENCGISEENFEKSLNRKTKDQLNLIREKIESMKEEGGMEFTKKNLEKVVAKSIKEKEENVVPGMSLFRELGIDSLESVELCADLEKNFGVEVHVEDLQEADTLDNLFAILVKKRVKRLICDICCINTKTLDEKNALDRQNILDSQNLLEIIAGLEEIFQVHTDGAGTGDYESVETITSYLLEKIKE